MTFTVEDGTGIAGANAYVSVDDCAAYAMARGLTFAASPTAEGEQAIVRATAAVDALYRGRFPGYRTAGRSQGREWPRTAAYDAEGLAIAGNEIPQEVVDATCELAIRELASPGSVVPDLERGGAVQELQAGSVRIVYGSNAIAQTVMPLVDGIMAPLLGQQKASFVGTAVRG